jgi:hypothetical protein
MYIYMQAVCALLRCAYIHYTYTCTNGVWAQPIHIHVPTYNMHAHVIGWVHKYTHLCIYIYIYIYIYLYRYMHVPWLHMQDRTDRQTQHICTHVLTSSWQVKTGVTNFPAGHDEHEDAAGLENSPGLHCCIICMYACVYIYIYIYMCTYIHIFMQNSPGLHCFI